MSHQSYMNRAYESALKGRGKTSPNPMVGAVIVKNGKIIAQGYHHHYGGIHAEVDALNKLKIGEAKGATLYVTLEPCSHFGKQPPCTDALIKAGIKTVIIGCKDPNPLNNGKSIKLLRKHGIDVNVGILAEKLIRLNESFNKYITLKRPWVIGKIAQTLDGKTATLKGESKWITGESARAFAHQMRFNVDAIMVGSNTAVIDDPQLNSTPRKKLIKIILDSKLRINPKAKLFDGCEPKHIIIFTATKPHQLKFKALSQHATIIQAPVRQGLLDLNWILDFLGTRCIASVLIEGGATLLGHALAARCVDQMMIYIAPKMMGEGLSSVNGLKLSTLADMHTLKELTVKNIGDDILLTGYVT